MDLNSPVVGQPPIAFDSPPKQSRLPLILLILVLMGVSLSGGFYLGRFTTLPASITTTAPKENTTPAQPKDIIKPATPISAIETNNETTNWKTYTSRELNYSFKHPSDWNYTIERPAGGTYNFYITGVGNGEFDPIEVVPPNTQAIAVFYYPNGFTLGTTKEKITEATNLTHFLKVLNRFWPDGDLNKYRREEKIIDGKPAIRYVPTSGDTERFPTSWILNLGGGILEIKERFDTGYPETQVNQMFDQILSTFRFLD